MAAGLPGVLALSGKKRAVFAFSNKRELELFPSGEAGGAAPGFPFPPPSSSAVARRPRDPGLLLRAWRGKPGPGGWRPRGVEGGGEVLEGMQQGSSPANPLLAASELQDPRATSGGGQLELSPHLQSPGLVPAQRCSHLAAPRAPLCLG